MLPNVPNEEVGMRLALTGTHAPDTCVSYSPFMASYKVLHACTSVHSIPHWQQVKHQSPQLT